MIVLPVKSKAGQVIPMHWAAQSTLSKTAEQVCKANNRCALCGWQWHKGLWSAVAEKLRAKLVELKKAHTDNSAGVTTCFQTMQKYLANVYKDPTQEKFRNIRLGNPAFQQRVGAFPGSIEALELCGFKVILTVLHAGLRVPMYHRFLNKIIAMPVLGAWKLKHFEHLVDNY